MRSSVKAWQKQRSGAREWFAVCTKSRLMRANSQAQGFVWEKGATFGTGLYQKAAENQPQSPCRITKFPFDPKMSGLPS